MSKFANAIGIWELDIGNQKFNLEPKMNHVRKFRNILTNDDNRKDKAKLFDVFAEFLSAMIHEQYKEEMLEDIQGFVEININPLFEEAMIAFRWSTRDEMNKSKDESLKEIKKQISNV